MIVVYGVIPPAFAAFDISKSGDLTATTFDELGFDPTGLVGYWQLNGNAKDSSGYHVDGTIYGATATTDRFEVANGAMNFNGSNQWIYCGNVASLNVSGAVITISAWVKANSFSGWGRIVSKLGNESGFWNGYAMLVASNSVLLQIYNTSFGNEAVVAYTMPLHEFHQVTYVYNSVNKKLYVDGSYIGQTSSTAAVGTTTSNLNIGRGGDNTQYFNGSIDEVKIFSRALSASEILAMYNHEKGKFSVGKDGKAKAVSFVEDPALPVQMRSKKQSLTVKGHLIQQ